VRVGLFGGTFDPVHNGHLDVARVARAHMQLDEVWFVPARRPPHRGQPGASAAHRFAMVAMAIAGADGLRVCDVEMEAEGPSYTVETLDRVERLFPVVERPVFFIAGADTFCEIRTWHRYAELLDRSRFIVVSRPGQPVRSLRRALPDLAPRMHDTPCIDGGTPGIFLVDAPTADVSATDARRLLSGGDDTTGRVPSPVVSHAIRHGLYRDRATSETSFE